MEKGVRTRRTLNIPHIPLEDHISPNDVRALMALGPEGGLKQLMRHVNDRLADLRASHEQPPASMRPRLLCRGNLSLSAGEIIHESSFNEAAAFMPRKREISFAR